MGLRELYHRFRGRDEFYQLYANITYSTPESCLEYHGEIYLEKEEIPSISGCDIEVLSFPVEELAHFRDKKKKMKELAERELERREIFRQGKRKLEEGKYDEAVSRFERSVKLDVFLPELEDLVSEHGSSVPTEVLEKLEDLFVLGYKEKFGQKRYERLPERMREDRKEAGVEKIRELFG